MPPMALPTSGLLKMPLRKPATPEPLESLPLICGATLFTMVVSFSKFARLSSMPPFGAVASACRNSARRACTSLLSLRCGCMRFCNAISSLMESASVGGFAIFASAMSSSLSLLLWRSSRTGGGGPKGPPNGIGGGKKPGPGPKSGA